LLLLSLSLGFFLQDDYEHSSSISSMSTGFDRSINVAGGMDDDDEDDTYGKRRSYTGHQQFFDEAQGQDDADVCSHFKKERKV
jgi:hypothetical protein